MMNDHDMNAWGWAGMALMAVITVAIVALVCVVARRAGEPRVHAPTAREQLDARLARGEIDPNEYRERLEVLHGHRIEE
jgi:putative membrane protein